MNVSEAKEFLKNMSCSCPHGNGPYTCNNENCKLGQAVKVLTQPKASSKIKAWKVIDKYGDCGNNIIFAETRAKAVYIALSSCDEYEDCKWTDMEARRFPEYDQYYDGKPVVDWENPEHRTRLVRDFGWHCLDYWLDEIYVNAECKTCAAKEWCEMYQTYQEDLKSED